MLKLSHVSPPRYQRFNSKLEESKKRLEEQHAADKYLEKTFKKEMSSISGEYFDFLFKLFRGRKAVPPKHPAQSGGKLERRTSHSTTTNDSTSDILSMKKSFSKMSTKKRSMTKSLRNIQESVDSIETRDDAPGPEMTDKSELLMHHLREEEFESDNGRDLEEMRLIDPYFVEQTESADAVLRRLTKPMELSFTIWNRFLEFRKLKMAKDKESEELSHCIASMQAEVNALRSNQRIILESIEEIGRARQLLVSRREKYKLDCELFFCVAQGAVEVEESPVVTDMRQSVMCDRAVIEKLNRVILDAGTEQIQRLHEIKNFRRGINLLNWRAKVLDLEYRYYTLLTTEYQLRRVTKKDQETIKAGGQDSKHKNEVQSLERKLQFTKSTMDAKIKEKKKALKKQQNRIQEVTASNTELASEIAKLETDVTSKQQIVNIRGSVSVQDEQRLSGQKKMDAVVTRRKLVDLVKAQSEEIDFLRNELDRLRRRTFPSFSIADPQH